MLNYNIFLFYNTYKTIAKERKTQNTNRSSNNNNEKKENMKCNCNGAAHVNTCLVSRNERNKVRKKVPVKKIHSGKWNKTCQIIHTMESSVRSIREKGRSKRSVSNVISSRNKQHQTKTIGLTHQGEKKIQEIWTPEDKAQLFSSSIKFEFLFK